MVLENLLDPIFSPLLLLPSWLAILIISVIITLLTTIAYKYLTDQKRMKELKAEMKQYQKKLKVLSKEDPKKAMKLQKEMMGKNMELMKHSFKPTLYTILPIIIIFGWLNAHMAYDPLAPNEPFTVTVEMAKDTAGSITLDIIPDELGVYKDKPLTQQINDEKASWILLGETGEYQLTFVHEETGKTFTENIIITNETGRYTNPLQKINDKPFKTLTISNEKIRPLEGFPIIGNWGWIGIYILFSVGLSFGLRKAMGIA